MAGNAYTLNPGFGKFLVAFPKFNLLILWLVNQYFALVLLHQAGFGSRTPNGECRLSGSTTQIEKQTCAALSPIAAESPQEVALAALAWAGVEALAGTAAHASAA